MTTTMMLSNGEDEHEGANDDNDDEPKTPFSTINERQIRRPGGEQKGAPVLCCACAVSLPKLLRECLFALCIQEKTANALIKTI